MEQGTPAPRIFERVGRGNVYEKGLAEGAFPAKVVGMLKRREVLPLEVGAGQF